MKLARRLAAPIAVAAMCSLGARDVAACDAIVCAGIEVRPFVNAIRVGPDDRKKRLDYRVWRGGLAPEAEEVDLPVMDNSKS